MQIINLYSKNRKASRACSEASLYILRGFRKLVITFFFVKNIPKLINQQLKNKVKIVSWKKKVSYWFFTIKKYLYLKLKNEVKIVNWQK